MINKITLFLFICTLTLNAQNLKIASYNVENIFDLHYDGTEYKEYIPNNYSNWNKKTYFIKLKNIAKVIKELDADILALQEIESQKVLQNLLEYIPQYKYFSFVKNKNSAIGLAVISKYKIVKTTQVKIESNKKYRRPIQEVTLEINDFKLLIYNNHWSSKRSSENERVEYALTLQNYLNKQQITQDYIILGDFNSNYDEFQTLKSDKKLNNTYGNTGINQVLNTTINKKFITKKNILSFDKRVHFNLWQELDIPSRFSYKYKSNNNTPDNILLSSTLFDNKNISYVYDSFKVFKPKYLFENRIIKRWKIKGKYNIHQGVGYSDHLPIVATFTTNKILHNNLTIKKKILTIKDLYHIDNMEKISKIYNAIVIYKNNSSAIIKQKNGRAIYVYKQAKNLELGKTYDITIENTKTYNGLKEITKIGKIRHKNNYENFVNLYLNANSINILDYKYQNEIITQLQATYKKGYLHYSYKKQIKKIKLYTKETSLLPKNGQKITIIAGHLGFYKSKPQIVIYKESDFVN